MSTQDIEFTKQLDYDIANKRQLSTNQVGLILENALDTLTEVGNGTTDEQLHKELNYLFALRDLWFSKLHGDPKSQIKMALKGHSISDVIDLLAEIKYELLKETRIN